MKENNTATQPKSRARFYVDRKGRFVHDAVIFMLLSVAFRVVGCWGLWNDRFFAVTQLLLPVAACLLFILCLRFLGDKAFPLTILPVLMGAAFFAIKIVWPFNHEIIVQIILCVLLCLLVSVLYILTAVGIIRTKWLLVPLFALMLVYRIAVEDLAAVRNTVEPVLFSEGMQELSVLAAFTAMIFAALAMKKRKNLEDANLPKIKDPVVIVPKPAKPAAKGAEAKPAATAAAPAASAAQPAVPAQPAAEQKPEQAAPSTDTAAADKPAAADEAAPAGESSSPEEKTETP